MRTIDTKMVVVVAVLAIVVLIAAWRLTEIQAYMPGATWWQAWPFR